MRSPTSGRTHEISRTLIGSSLFASSVDAVAGLRREDGAEEDSAVRIHMLLGELGIQVAEDTFVSQDPSEPDGEPEELTEEILAFLSDPGGRVWNPQNTYFECIGNHPLLAQEEEQLCGRMWQEDRNPEGWARLVEGNLRFVVKEAGKFFGRGMEGLDLISEGNLGLIEAAKRFDPTRENRFLTYAAWWIRQSIFRALAETSCMISLPQKVAGEMAHFNRVTRRLALDLGRPPGVAEIVAAGPRFESRDAARLLVIQQTIMTVPLEGLPAGSFAPNATANSVEVMDAEKFQDQIRQNLAVLNGRARQVIVQHFGLEGNVPMTLEAIGLACDPPISRERVRQIEEKAFERLRKRWEPLLDHYLESLADRQQVWPTPMIADPESEDVDE
jgi:RNA polymerase primary sigma factor